MAPKLTDLTGKSFGKWLVLGKAHRDKNYIWHWVCRCDCDRLAVVRGSKLIAGKSTQCRSCANHSMTREARKEA